MTKENRELLEKAKKHGDITDNGVAFDWWISGPDGAHFVLLKELGHTAEDMITAKAQLRRDRDVSSLTIKDIS